MSNYPDDPLDEDTMHNRDMRKGDRKEFWTSVAVATFLIGVFVCGLSGIALTFYYNDAKWMLLCLTWVIFLG